MEDLEKAYHIKRLRDRYGRVGKIERGEILNEVERLFEVGRRQARRLMAPGVNGRPRKPGKRGCPGKYQDAEFRGALRKVWKSSRFMCSRFLKAAMPEWLPAIERKYGQFSPNVRERLMQISPPTIDRILKPWKGMKGKSLTRSGGYRDEIPIQQCIWNVQEPGHLEADTVAHCGTSAMGEFTNSLTMTDLATTWTEVRAVHSKASGPIVQAVEDIEAGLPFNIVGYDSDNGTEVLNQHILNYFINERTERGRTAVKVTRSRAYHKNDNAHVEQKNNSIVRRYLGYERFEFAELTPLINYYLRDIVSPLLNHFYPSFKLADKVLMGARKHRVYKAPVTPYQRVMASIYVPDEQKNILKSIHESLDPIELTNQEHLIRWRINNANKLLLAGQDASAILKIPPCTVSPHEKFRAARRPELALYRAKAVAG
jgi:hypothetical protein